MSQLDNEEIEDYLNTAIEQAPEVDKKRYQFGVIGRDHKDGKNIFVPQVATISDRKTNRVLECTPPQSYTKDEESEEDDELDMSSLPDDDKEELKKFNEDTDDIMLEFRRRRKEKENRLKEEKVKQSPDPQMDEIKESHQDAGMDDSFWDVEPVVVSPKKVKQSTPSPSGGLSIGNIQDEYESEDIEVESPSTTLVSTPPLAQDEDAVIIESIDDDYSDDEDTITYVVESISKVSSGSETTLGSDTIPEVPMDGSVFVDISTSSAEEGGEYDMDLGFRDNEYRPNQSDDESDSDSNPESEDDGEDYAELPDDVGPDDELDDELLNDDITDMTTTFQNILKQGAEGRKELLAELAKEALYEISGIEGHRQFFVGVPTKGRTAKRPDIRKLEKSPATQEEEKAFRIFFVHYMEMVYEEYCKEGWSEGEEERGFGLHKKLLGNIGPVDISNFFEDIKEKLRTLTAVTCTMRSDGKSPLGTSGHIADMIRARRYTTNAAIHVMDFVMMGDYETLLILDDFKIEEDSEHFSKEPVWYCAFSGKPIQNDEPCYALVRTGCKSIKRPDGRPYEQSNDVENQEGTLILSKEGYECSLYLLQCLVSMKNMEKKIRNDLRCLFSKDEPDELLLESPDGTSSEDKAKSHIVEARKIIQGICKEEEFNFHDILASFCVGLTQSVMNNHHTFIRYLPYTISVVYGTVMDHTVIYTFDYMLELYAIDVENGLVDPSLPPIELFDEDAIRKQEIENIRSRFLRQQPNIDPRKIPIDEDRILEKVQRLKKASDSKVITELLDHFVRYRKLIPPSDLEYKDKMTLNEDADSFFMKPPNVSLVDDTIFSMLERKRCGLLCCAKVEKPLPGGVIVENTRPPIEPAKPSKPPPVRTKSKVTVVDHEDEVVATVDVRREEIPIQSEPEGDLPSDEAIHMDLVEVDQAVDEVEDKTLLYQAKSLDEIIEKFMKGGRKRYTIQMGTTDKSVGTYRLMATKDQKRARMHISEDAFPHLLRHIGKNLCPVNGFPLGFGNSQIQAVFDGFGKGLTATLKAIEKCVGDSFGFEEDDPEGKMTVQFIEDAIIAFWDALLVEPDDDTSSDSDQPTEDFFSPMVRSFDKVAVDNFNKDNDILPFQGSVDYASTPERFISMTKRTINMDSAARRTIERWVRKARKYAASKGLKGYAERFGLDEFDEDSFTIVHGDISPEQVSIFDTRVLPFILLTFSAVFPLCSALVPVSSYPVQE